MNSPETLDNIALLNIASSRLKGIYAKWSEREGFTSTEGYIIYNIMVHEQCTQSLIVNKRAFPKQTISSACQQLHEKGWIDYVVNPNNRREKFLVLTEKTKTELLPKFAEQRRQQLQTIEEFGEERLQHLLDEFNALYTLLAKNMNVTY